MLDYQIKKLEAKVLGLSLEQVLIGVQILSLEQKKELASLVERLKDGYPLDYLLGSVQVLGLDLEINESVLIPRPETEEWLLELTNGKGSKLDFMKFGSSNLVLDLGTGSGLIGLYLSKYFKQVLAVDISSDALVVASNNAKNNQIENIEFFESDGLLNVHLRKTILAQAVGNPWVLVANLPYVPESDLEFAKQYGVGFEPKIAIYSGSDGLELYKQILSQIKVFIIQPEKVFFELDPRNILEAQRLLVELGYSTSIWSDSGGFERLLMGKKVTKFNF
jgi:release factor glutamine methyltransferase